MTGRVRGEAGITIVELVVAVSLLSAVSAVFLPLLSTATRSVRPMQAESEATDGLRNAMTTIGRELRTADCIAEPVAGAGAGNRLRFSTRRADGAPYEVTYTAGGGQLERQVTGESLPSILGTGLVATGDAFTRLSTYKESVELSFHVQPDPGERARDSSTVIAARNAWQPC